LFAAGSDLLTFTGFINNNDSNRTGSNLMINDSHGSNRTGTNMMVDANWNAPTGFSFFAIVQAGANTPQEVPTGTNSFTLTGTGPNRFGSGASASRNSDDSIGSDTDTNLSLEVPTGTNSFTLTGTSPNRFGSSASASRNSDDSIGSDTDTNLSLDTEQEPKRIRSNFYNKERRYVRQIANLQQQLNEARQQKATTVGEALLTQFSRVAETTALRSALEM
jgi:hypothetical protein